MRGVEIPPGGGGVGGGGSLLHHGDPPTTNCEGLTFTPPRVVNKTLVSDENFIDALHLSGNKRR